MSAVGTVRTGTDRQALRRRLAIGLQVLLVAAWLGWAGCCWWSQPRPVGPEQAERDLTAGRVVSFARLTSWGDPSPGWVTMPDERGERHGWILAWSTPAGQVRYTGAGVVEQQGRLRRSAVHPATLMSSDQADRLATRLAAAGDAGSGGSVLDRGAFSTAAWATSSALALICLGWVLFGPRPRRGTRWFWLWVSLIPFGLGVLAWVFLERPGTPRTPPAGGHEVSDEDGARPGDEAGDGDSAGDGGRSRARGWVGAAALVGFSVLLTLGQAGAQALFGTGVVPG